MIQFETVIDIDRPIEEVFNFLADFENMPHRWNYYVSSVVNLTPGPIKAGTKFHQVRRSDEQDYLITKLEHGRVVEVTTVGLSPTLVMRFELTPSLRGTRLMDTWILGTKLPKPFELLAARRIRHAAEENLGKLKELLGLRSSKTAAPRMLPDQQQSKGETRVFLILLKYMKPLSEVDRLLGEHNAYLDRNYAAGCFLVSGRREPRRGGVIVARAPSLSDIEATVAEDPFVREGIATRELVQFVPSRSALGFETLFAVGSGRDSSGQAPAPRS
jgi:uncharacterized protein YciI